MPRPTPRRCGQFLLVHCVVWILISKVFQSYPHHDHMIFLSVCLALLLVVLHFRREGASLEGEEEVRASRTGISPVFSTFTFFSYFLLNRAEVFWSSFPRAFQASSMGLVSLGCGSSTVVSWLHTLVSLLVTVSIYSSSCRFFSFILCCSDWLSIERLYVGFFYYYFMEVWQSCCWLGSCYCCVYWVFLRCYVAFGRDSRFLFCLVVFSCEGLVSL